MAIGGIEAALPGNKWYTTARAPGADGQENFIHGSTTSHAEGDRRLAG